ncbi:hypothetical protein [Homoserinimonas hongtaonis]|uniref:hypothetical protein n=1 Tax=Homoserinimonas hongtaonis TaxID=2079791 RepID=UPI000D33B429|nr:hypothetical protein [Salinibacterium hongtaonis]AWB88503.1 hypothetical protein C2138_02115 [Salinibacterium hongtaonis]
MPSYRITITIGALRPGVKPEQVLPAATEAAAAITTVEAFDLGIVAGAPRIVIRFTADDESVARRVAVHVIQATHAVAEALHPKLTRRDGGRWYVVR